MNLVKILPRSTTLPKGIQTTREDARVENLASMLSAQEVLTILSNKETAMPAGTHRDNSKNLWRGINLCNQEILYVMNHTAVPMPSCSKYREYQPACSKRAITNAKICIVLILVLVLHHPNDHISH